MLNPKRAPWRALVIVLALSLSAACGERDDSAAGSGDPAVGVTQKYAWYLQSTTPVALGRFFLSPLVKRRPIDEAMARMSQ